MVCIGVIIGNSPVSGIFSGVIACAGPAVRISTIISRCIVLRWFGFAIDIFAHWLCIEFIQRLEQFIQLFVGGKGYADISFSFQRSFDGDFCSQFLG